MGENLLGWFVQFSTKASKLQVGGNRIVVHKFSVVNSGLGDHLGSCLSAAAFKVLWLRGRL